MMKRMNRFSIARFYLLNGIVPAGVKRLAFEKSDNREHQSFRRPVALDGLNRVTRTGGLEPAGSRQERRDCLFVGFD